MLPQFLSHTEQPHARIPGQRADRDARTGGALRAAGAVLTSPQHGPDSLYAGVPARRVKALDPGMAYFRRTEGYVW